MPTLEIISLDSRHMDPDPDAFVFAIQVDAEPVSHRGLFNPFLSSKKGYIIHIGNPDLKEEDYGFFADEILTDDSDYFINIPDQDDIEDDYWGEGQAMKFTIKDEYRDGIDRLLKLAYLHSPVNTVYFLTDYQFGPKQAEIIEFDTLHDFWRQHDTRCLSYNTLYIMKGITARTFVS